MFACRLCSNLGSKIVQTPKSLASMLKNIVSYPPPNPCISEMAFSHRFQKVYTYPPLRNEILVLWTKNGEKPENTRICSALAYSECPREICICICMYMQCGCARKTWALPFFTQVAQLQEWTGCAPVAGHNNCPVHELELSQALGCSPWLHGWSAFAIILYRHGGLQCNNALWFPFVSVSISLVSIILSFPSFPQVELTPSLRVHSISKTLDSCCRLIIIQG